MSADDSKPTNTATASEEYGPNVHVSSHPVLSHKITILRSTETDPSAFRAAMREVTYHLGYEATKNLTTRSIPISVSIPKAKLHENAPTTMECTGSQLVERVALVPILRSGLGMADSMLQLLPHAASYHIGMYKVTGQNPVMYFNRLPRKCQSQVAYVLDPVIATASTVISVVGLLKKVSIGKTSGQRWFVTGAFSHVRTSFARSVGRSQDSCDYRHCLQDGFATSLTSSSRRSFDSGNG